jgi:hypothetical protein
MKSTGRCGVQTNMEQNKQKHTNIKYSRFRNNRISVLVVLVLLLQHLVFVFVFKQKLCLSLSGGWGDWPVFFLSFSSSCLVSSSLSEVWLVLRFWRSDLWSTSHHAVGLLDLSQACLELVSGGIGALLFSQANMVWRSFVWAGGSGCWNFYSSWCFFFPAKCGSSISAKFLTYGAHTVCFCTLVAPWISSFLLLTHPGDVIMVLQSEYFTQLREICNLTTLPATGPWQISRHSISKSILLSPILVQSCYEAYVGMTGGRLYVKPTLGHSPSCHLPPLFIQKKRIILISYWVLVILFV